MAGVLEPADFGIEWSLGDLQGLARPLAVRWVDDATEVDP